MRGHIRKRAKGTWSVVLDRGRDPVTGKRRQLWRTVKGTKKQAEAALAKLINEFEAGHDLDPTRVTVSEYLSQWLADSDSRLAPSTLQRYERLFRLQVQPCVGHLQLAKLRPVHLQSLYRRLLGDGLSAQTVLHVHRALFTALRHAVKLQMIPVNPAEAVTPPKPVQRDVHPMTPADAEMVLSAVAGTWLDIPVVLALGTGLRRGEICGLRWGDLDLEASRLRVMQTVQHIGKELRFLPPKTHRSRRSIALPAFVVESLRRHALAQGEMRALAGSSWQNHNLVVCHPDGSPLRPDSVTHAFSKVAKRIGLPLTFHGLRHAHASLMLAGGVHLKVVSDRLGHSSIAITADLYSHVAPALDDEAAAALDGLLRRR